MFDFDGLSPVTLAATAGLLIVSYTYSSGITKSKNEYAPGPKGLPFFGTRFSSTPWKDFEQWGKKYGARSGLTSQASRQC